MGAMPGMPPGPGGRPGMMGPMGPPRPEDIIRQISSRYPDVDPEEVRALIHSHFREELEQYQKLARHRPPEAMEQFNDVAHEACELLEFKRRHPEAFEMRMDLRTLEHEAERISDSYAHRSTQEKGELKQQLQRTLSEAFSLKQELMQFELIQLRRELKELEALVEKREANQEAIIGRRLREVTGETDYLDW